MQSNKTVLFVGTPCQIEGVKAYLTKEYDNLICVSIMCHGVPSPQVFKRYLEEKEKINQAEIDNIQFRNKENGWHKYNVQYHFKNGQDEKEYFVNDIYMQGFLKNYFLRESCYNCEMRFHKKNSADLMIGDFWGIENVFPEMDDDKGISALIVNTEKGEKLFNKVKTDIEYRQTDFESILKGNPLLMSSVKYTKNREKFFEMLKNTDIKTAIDTLNNEDIKKELEELKKYLQEKEREVDYLKGQLEVRDINIENIKREKAENERLEKEYKEELHKVYGSKRWKYTTKLANIVNKFRKSKG